MNKKNISSISGAVPSGALLLSVLLALLLAGPAVRGASPTASAKVLGLRLAPGASLELDGDSSLHRYSAKAHDMKVDIDLDEAHAAPAGKPADIAALIRGHYIKTFELIVPVDKLSSGEKGLDANMRKALKGDQFKVIRFRMDSYDASAPAPAGAAIKMTLHGRLSLAGVERKIDVGATGVPVAGGLRVDGSKDLLMTDYQIKPPTMMLGTIKTKNLITVKFNATLQNASAS